MMAIEARLAWQDAGIAHCDRLLLPPSALQADGALVRLLPALTAGETVTLDASRWLKPAGEPEQRLPATAFRLRTAPVVGRFYPRLAFAGLAQGREDLRPCRLLAVEGDTLRVDVNHPLAGRGVGLTLQATQTQAARGRFLDLLQGPGMQTPASAAATTDHPPAAFTRADATEDAAFYARPRLVHHLDAACRAELTRLYGRFLRPGLEVLDLMSSWASHLPETPAELEVVGLGMNAEELAANPRLARWLVHDLNRHPQLPFPAARFDLVLCTASVEYLIHPRAVFAELKRVLRPGGLAVFSFSDRWFPPKVIRLWTELHPFERLGYVLGLLQQAGFTALHSETLRGLARPPDDPYIAERDYSDPLFAAWGQA
ncbi:MAG: methyltransferase domain-containing protein [Thiobacillaceae bacterium]|nr:methyltransferase domain-containing protein [Thiobacillaceae bacterium]